MFNSSKPGLKTVLIYSVEESPLVVIRLARWIIILLRMPLTLFLCLSSRLLCIKNKSWAPNKLAFESSITSIISLNMSSFDNISPIDFGVCKKKLYKPGTSPASTFFLKFSRKI